MPQKLTKRQSMKQYMIHFAILYGRFGWLERLRDGSVRVSSASLMKHFKCSYDNVKQFISNLEKIGGFQEVEWLSYGGIIIKPAVPIDMARNLAAPDGTMARNLTAPDGTPARTQEASDIIIDIENISRTIPREEASDSE